MLTRHLPTVALCLGTTSCTSPATIGGLGDRDGGATSDGAPGDATGSRDGAFCDDTDPLGLLLVVDDDASMTPWWTALRGGVGRFLSASVAEDFSVGLEQPRADCVATGFAPRVPIAPVSESTPDILAALPATVLATNPLVQVLSASVGHAREWASAHGSPRAAVVLLSDTSPAACDGAYANYVAAAEDTVRTAALGSPSVATYVIAVGSLLTPDDLSRAAGTEPIRLGVLTTEAAVEAALHDVVRRARGCSDDPPSSGP